MRGGLLRQGSVLTVTSYATRTSPVIRGKWILDNVLGVPPPPPPPNVPALKENTGSAGKTLSIRERMAEHRDESRLLRLPSVDGPGRLLAGELRCGRPLADGRGRQARSMSPAAFPTASKFDGVSGLQQALLSRPENFATTLTEKLLTYALGRGVESYDAPAVRKIVREAGENDFRFSSFILGIVNSTPFQMRRSL